ncbi:MAG: hypothetical protein PF549_04190 [Patescibacteria group bacterium]|jgi:hypothetical protein|nr:hypothetical protein [Patescibacteria group bacterium]
MAKKTMLGDLVKKIISFLPIEMLGVCNDLVDKLISKTGQGWFVELKKFLRREECWTEKEVFLRFISDDEKLVIKACNGLEILLDAKDLFAYIDNNFRNFEANQPGQSTEKTSVVVYEAENSGTFTQLFGSLSGDLDKLCFTQAQIIGFVRSHRNWLRTDGHGTFFLFKSWDHFFIAIVRFDSDDGLRVNIRRFGDDIFLFADYCSRFVVP